MASTLVCLVLAVSGRGAVRTSGFASQKLFSFSTPEKRLSIAPSHISELTTAEWPLALPRCGDARPPEALLTPDPLYLQKESAQVRVSFVIGPDGQVHSPFVLESGSRAEEETILRALSRWRFRPALCNGVPTDSEAVVRFVLQ